MIDSPAVEWGVTIDRVEIKDVSLPETMKRSMARQAEADRERRARVINADAELQASRNWRRRPSRWPRHPPRCNCDCCRPWWCGRRGEELHLVLPFPVELLRFLERAQSSRWRDAPPNSRCRRPRRRRP